MRKLTLLVVDDEESYRALARFSLDEERWEVLEAADGAEALAAVAERGPDLVLVDAHLGRDHGDGVAVVARLRALRPGLRVLVYSVLNEDVAARALAAGALACLPKPARYAEVAAFAQEAP